MTDTSNTPAADTSPLAAWLRARFLLKPSPPAGPVKLKIAGVVLDLSPKEARLLGFSTAGFMF